MMKRLPMPFMNYWFDVEGDTLYYSCPKTHQMIPKLHGVSYRGALAHLQIEADKEAAKKPRAQTA